MTDETMELWVGEEDRQASESWLRRDVLADARRGWESTQGS